MIGMKLWVLYLGNFWFPDKGVITPGIDVGKPWCGPILGWYVEHSDAKIVIDTGMDPDWRDKWPKELLGAPAGPKLRPEDHIVSRLKEIGVKPDDIDIVINTHLHTDHAGGNRFFRNATFVVQKDEIRYAYFPDRTTPTPGYARSDFDHPLRYHGVTGDYEVVKGIKLIRTPGHSPGHQSVVLKLEQTGTVVITGDAVFGRENLGPPIILSNVGWLNQPAALESTERLKHIEELEHGRLFFSHDSKATGDVLDGTSQWETEFKDKSPFV